MTLAHRYYEFRQESEEFDGEVGETPASAEANLQAFENGYQAGWQDAVAAHDTEKAKISSEFAQNLQDMSFTYQEARSKLLASLKPVAISMIEKLLPGITREALRANLAMQVDLILRGSTENAIELVVSPANLDTVQEFMDHQSGVPFLLKAEPSLADGQVYLKSGQIENCIDIEGMCEKISKALSSFVDHTASGSSHG
jgi:flagellar assembly protein FliH